MKKIFITSIYFILTAYSYSVLAQDLNKIIFVESNYKPEIQQAEKLVELPELTDTSQAPPQINYTVLPSHLNTKYQIKPIKAAKLIGSPLDELYKSYIKLGIGNYTTPLVEFSIHNLRSKEYSIGAYAFHKSSHTKMELENGTEQPAGYSHNRFGAYGKRFYQNVNVEGELFFNTDKYRHYGYNTDILDTVLENKNIRQYFTQVGGKVAVYSTYPDSGKMQYKIGFNADYFGDEFKKRENHLEIPAGLAFNIKSFRLNLNADYHMFATKFHENATNRNVLQISPVLMKRKDDWEIFVGANSYYTIDSANSEFSLFPKAQLKFSIINNALEAFFGIDGYLELNNMSKIAMENPYLKPGYDVSDTKHRLIGYGGVQGFLSSKSGYKLRVSFNSTDNAYFYVNDTSTVLENQFVVVNDEMELITFGGEMWYNPYTFLNFYLKAEYNSYTPSLEEKAWHLPAIKSSFRTSYNFKQKIYADLDLIYLGKRYAKNMHVIGETIELEPIWDLNLKLEYRYSKVLSAFVDFYNLLSKQYYIWNQYPSQKINVIAGVSYKF